MKRSKNQSFGKGSVAVSISHIILYSLLNFIDLNCREYSDIENFKNTSSRGDSPLSLNLEKFGEITPNTKEKGKTPKRRKGFTNIF